MIDRDDIDVGLARRLIADQFPQWARYPVTRVDLDGWDNRTFRLGDDLSIRLPTGDWYAKQVEKEHRWLPLLAPRLPLPIPVPVALGRPDGAFPWSWSIYRWLDGTPAALDQAFDVPTFSTDLGRFLAALYAIDANDGPPAGEHNFFRGGPLSTYEAETHEAIAALGDEIPRDAVERAWEDAMRTRWEREPVWVHGDVAVGNLLVRDGRLAAVIDFGCSGVGDPASDMVIAWTLLSGESRDRFRAEVGADDGTWSRGRGWCLWKALITLVEHLESGSPNAALSRRDIDQVLADHARER